MDLPDYNPFDWLITCSVSDCNYRSALKNATEEQLRQAIKFMEGRPGNICRIKACRAELKRRGKLEIKNTAANELF